jgi:hypothetical protein
MTSQARVFVFSIRPTASVNPRASEFNVQMKWLNTRFVSVPRGYSDRVPSPPVVPQFEIDATLSGCGKTPSVILSGAKDLHLPVFKENPTDPSLRSG